MADYARKEPRAPLQCTVLVTLDGGRSLLGEVVDLSTRGAAVVVPARLPRGTVVTLLLDSAQLPDVGSVRGGVLSVVPSGRAAGGEPVFRLGIEFTHPQPKMAHGTGAAPIVAPHGGPALATTAGGRERVYQQAFACLTRGEFAAAIDLAKLAVNAEPRNVHYRLLHHRASAEQALAAGAPADARRELDRARALAPAATELSDLDTRLLAAEAEARARRGFFARLLGRQ